ncbi:peptidase [Pseudomonas sp. ODNR1LW]|nr:peptidase [Pseudomonas sp. ODNR1LW]
MIRPPLAAASLLVLAWAASPALAQQAQSLRIGASVEGALTSSDTATTGEDAYRYDDYRFSARAGQRLEAVLRSEAFDAYLALYAEGEETPIAEDDDGLEEGTHARLRFTPDAAGTYILRARTLSGTDGGDYSLSLRERPAAPRAPRPTGLRLGAETTGALTDRDPEQEDGGRYDAYSFRAAAGQRVIVTLESDAFDPKVLVGRMNGADFVELAQNDDGPDDGLNSRLVFMAPIAGEYVIRATALQDGEGRYTVGLKEAPPAPPAKPIAIGDSLDGALNDQAGTNDEGQRAEFYQFTATAGQRVAIEMSSNDFDTYLTLRRVSDNSVVAEDDDGAGSGTDSRIAQTLEAAGDYIIEARAFSGDGEGRFDLTLEEVAPPPAPSALGFAQTVQGEITPEDPQDDDGKHYDAFVFSGTEGERVQAVLRSGDFDAVLAIGSAEEGAFTALGTDDDGLGEGTDSRLNLTLPSTGDYVIRASPLSGEEKGLYSLELIARGPEPKPGSVLIGATARGALTEEDALTDEEGAYFDAYRFQVKKDEKLRITLVSNAFDAFIDLGEDGEDFSSIASDDDGLSDTHAKLDWTAPDDGWYVVRARSLGPNESGAYALTVERQP